MLVANVGKMIVTCDLWVLNCDNDSPWKAVICNGICLLMYNCTNDVLLIFVDFVIGIKNYEK